MQDSQLILSEKKKTQVLLMQQNKGILRRFHSLFETHKNDSNLISTSRLSEQVGNLFPSYSSSFSNLVQTLTMNQEEEWDWKKCLQHFLDVLKNEKFRKRDCAMFNNFFENEEVDPGTQSMNRTEKPEGVQVGNNSSLFPDMQRPDKKGGASEENKKSSIMYGDQVVSRVMATPSNGGSSRLRNMDPAREGLAEKKSATPGNTESHKKRDLPKRFARTSHTNTEKNPKEACRETEKGDISNMNASQLENKSFLEIYQVIGSCI